MFSAVVLYKKLEFNFPQGFQRVITVMVIHYWLDIGLIIWVV